eukprot:TRINITY_DN5302_c0_g2_i2.p1 TRINITY_DN5302_c0_g2~~TRINITY_DN5302_c0_g2_i2.p1  ORF type:complete len:2372 (+),score=586.19 TRINITY_DN5302_c0_g2_i2:122-7237(+)
MSDSDSDSSTNEFESLTTSSSGSGGVVRPIRGSVATTSESEEDTNDTSPRRRAWQSRFDDLTDSDEEEEKQKKAAEEAAAAAAAAAKEKEREERAARQKQREEEEAKEKERKALVAAEEKRKRELEAKKAEEKRRLEEEAANRKKEREREEREAAARKAKLLQQEEARKQEAEKQKQQQQEPPTDILSDEEELRREKAQLAAELQNTASCSQQDGTRSGSPSVASLPDESDGEGTPVKQVIKNTTTTTTTTTTPRVSSSPLSKDTITLKEIRLHMMELYKQHDPSKINTVDDILSTYPGREASFLDALSKRFTGVPFFAPKTRENSPKQVASGTSSPSPSSNLDRQFISILSSPFSSVLKEYPDFESYCTGLPSDEYSLIESGWSASNIDTLRPVLMNAVKNGRFSTRGSSSATRESPSSQVIRELLSMSLKDALSRYPKFEGFYKQLSEDRKVPFADWSMRNGGKLQAILSPCINLGYFDQPVEVKKPPPDPELPSEVNKELSRPLIDVCEDYPEIPKYLQTLPVADQSEFEQHWGMNVFKSRKVVSHLQAIYEKGCFKEVNKKPPPIVSKNLIEMKGILAVNFDQTLSSYPKFKSGLRDLPIATRVMVESMWQVANVEKLSEVLDGFIESGCFSDSEKDIIIQDVLSSHSSLESAKLAYPNLPTYLKKVENATIEVIEKEWGAENLQKLSPTLRGIFDAFTQQSEPPSSAPAVSQPEPSPPPPPPDTATSPLVEKLLSSTFQSVIAAYPVFKSKFEMLDVGKRVIIESNWGSQNAKKLTPLLTPFIDDNCFQSPAGSIEATAEEMEVISKALSSTFQEAMSANASFKKEFDNLDTSKRIILESNWGVQNVKKLTPILLPLVRLNCFEQPAEEGSPADDVVTHLLSQPFNVVIDNNPGFKSAFQKMDVGQRIRLESNWSPKNASTIETILAPFVETSCFGSCDAKDAEVILSVIGKPLQDVLRQYPLFKERFHALNGGDRVTAEQFWGSTQNFNKLEPILAAFVADGCFENNNNNNNNNTTTTVTMQELLCQPLKEVCEQYSDFKKGFDALPARERITIECNWGSSPDKIRKTEHILSPLLKQTVPGFSPMPGEKEGNDVPPEECDTPADGMFRPVNSTLNTPVPQSPVSIGQMCEPDDKSTESAAAGGSSPTTKGVTVLIAGSKSVINLPNGSDISDLLQHCATANSVELENLPAGELQAVDQNERTLSNRLDLSNITTDTTITIRKRAPLSIPSPITTQSTPVANTVKHVVIAPPVTPPDVGIPPLPASTPPLATSLQTPTKQLPILVLEVGCTVTANRVPLAPALKGRRGVVQMIKGNDVSIQFPRPWGTRVLPKELLRVVAAAPINMPTKKGSTPKLNTPRKKSSAKKPSTGKVQRKTESEPGAWETNEGKVHKISQISLQKRSSSTKRRVPLRSAVRSKSEGNKVAAPKPSEFDASFVREWKYSPSTVIKPFSYGTLIGKGKSVEEEVPCPDCGIELGKGGYCKVTGAAHLVEEPSKPRRMTKTEQDVSTNRMSIAPIVSQKRWELQEAKGSLTPPPNGYRSRSRTPSPSRTPRRQLNLHSSHNSDSTKDQKKKKKKKKKLKKKKATRRSPGSDLDHNVTESPGSDSGAILVSGLQQPFNELNGKYNEIRSDRYRHTNSGATICYSEGRWRLNDTRDKSTWLFSFDHLFGQWKRNPNNTFMDFCGVAGCSYPNISKSTPQSRPQSSPNRKSTERYNTHKGEPMTIEVSKLTDPFEHINGTYELCSKGLYQHTSQSAIVYVSEGRWKLNDTDDDTGWLFSHSTLMGQWFQNPTSSDYTGVIGSEYPLISPYKPRPITDSTLRLMLSDFYRNIGVGTPSSKIQNKVEKYLGSSSTNDLTNFLLRKYPNSTEADMPWNRYEYLSDGDKNGIPILLDTKIDSSRMDDGIPGGNSDGSKSRRSSQQHVTEQLMGFFAKNDPSQTIDDINRLVHRFENDLPALGGLLLQKYPNLSQADVPFQQQDVDRQHSNDGDGHPPDVIRDSNSQTESQQDSLRVSNSQAQMETHLAVFFKKHDDKRTPEDVTRLTDRFEKDPKALAELLLQKYPNSANDIPEEWVPVRETEMEQQLASFFKKHDADRTQSDITRLAGRFENDAVALGKLLLQKYPNSENDIPWREDESSELQSQLQQYFKIHDPKRLPEDIKRLAEQFQNEKTRLSELLLQKYPTSAADMAWNSDTSDLRQQLEEYFNFEDPLIHATEIQTLCDKYQNNISGLTEHLEKLYPNSKKNMFWLPATYDCCSVLSGTASPNGEDKCSEYILEQHVIEFFNKNDPLMQTAEIKSLLKEVDSDKKRLTKALLKLHPCTEADMPWLGETLSQMLDEFFETHDPLRELSEIQQLSDEYKKTCIR